MDKMIKVLKGWSIKLKYKIPISMYQMHQSVLLQAVEATSSIDHRAKSQVPMSLLNRLSITELKLV
jgi:hypothetical protein